MIQAAIETLFDVGFQAIGWAVMKTVSFGRYRGFQPEDILFEGTLGFVTFALVCYGVYSLAF